MTTIACSRKIKSLRGYDLLVVFLLIIPELLVARWYGPEPLKSTGFKVSANVLLSVRAMQSNSDCSGISIN